MEEAVRRLIGGYWWLLLLCTTVGAVGAAGYAVHQPPQYQAVARVQMSGGFASSNVEADAVTQWLQGIVTSPGLVQTAMTAAGVLGDPGVFADQSISVRRIGVSSVNDVVVSTPERGQSLAVAKALVAGATRYSNRARESDLERTHSLTQQIDRLTADQGRLIKALATASPGAVLELQARLSASQPTLADLLRQRADLVTATAARSSIGVLDPPHPVDDPVVLSPVQLGCLGALAGLIVGLGIAALLEMARPRVRGASWVAEDLGVPLLITLPRRSLTHPRTLEALHELCVELSLTLRRHPRGRVLLLAVEPRGSDRVARLAAELSRSTRLPIVAGVDALTQADGSLDPELGPDSEILVVAVAPVVVSRRRLDAFAARAAARGWPVLGVVIIRGRRIRGWSEFPAAAPAAAHADGVARGRSAVTVRERDLVPGVPHVIASSTHRQLNGRSDGRPGAATQLKGVES
ncbi:hypothetical protein FHX52_2769 [Humibacillus xanthopallidus]|uniref:Subunit length determinant protein n=2 Tax=Humibacillus xanthopallidus TaxID=412689 RepID=A0A543PPR4_9MICO|nr:hypothetical protein FHX52_2769 [Humibacillus xanthopallidus]